MGKKNRKARAGAGNADNESGMPRSVRRECLEITNILLDRCSVPFGVRGDEWNDFTEVYQLVEKLRKKQQNYVLEGIHREDHFDEFMSWLKKEQVDTSAVAIANFGDEGWGLKALRCIEMAELFLCIPRKLMLTTESAETSVLGGLLKEDRILQNMSNVVLALHLLCERSAPSSFWKPYINILPASYSTPLYFSPDEILLLKGSPAFGEVLNQFRNITRQYAYFFKLFQGYTDATNLPIKNVCFEDYRWAVSTVMTRQNQLPSKDGLQTIFGLIPLWDMCNHSNGQLTTDFSLGKDCSECFALREFTTGEQVYIYYGSRSNGELLLHNGFVYMDNEVDRLGVKLGISKNDQLYSMKAEVLARLSLLPARTFYLHTGEDTVDSDTLAYLRVFAMDHDLLKERLTGEEARALVQKLKDFSYVVSYSVESRAWSFLHTRCQLLLRAYPDSVQKDEALLSGSLTVHQRLCVQLRVSEKQVLVKTQQFAVRMQQELCKMLEQQQLQQQEKLQALDADKEHPALIRGKQTVDELLAHLEENAGSAESPTLQNNGGLTPPAEPALSVAHENNVVVAEPEKVQDPAAAVENTDVTKPPEKNTTETTEIQQQNADSVTLPAAAVENTDVTKPPEKNTTETTEIQQQNADSVTLQKGNVQISKSAEEEAEEERKLCEEIQNIQLTENTHPQFEDL